MLADCLYFHKLSRWQLVVASNRIIINDIITEDEIFVKISHMYRSEKNECFEVLNNKFMIQLGAGNTEICNTTSFPHEWYHKVIEYECLEICIYDRRTFFSNNRTPIPVCSDDRFQGFSWTDYFVGCDSNGDYVPMATTLTIIRDCTRLGNLSVFY